MILDFERRIVCLRTCPLLGEYPEDVLAKRRAEFVERVLVMRREQIMYALEETRLTHKQAKELSRELAEIQIKLDQL